MLLSAQARSWCISFGGQDSPPIAVTHPSRAVGAEGSPTWAYQWHSARARTDLCRCSSGEAEAESGLGEGTLSGAKSGPSPTPVECCRVDLLTPYSVVIGGLSPDSFRARQIAVTEELGHDLPSRSFQMPEQTGSVTLELPAGRCRQSPRGKGQPGCRQRASDPKIDGRLTRSVLRGALRRHKGDTP
jgi:hypothetical protein